MVQMISLKFRSIAKLDAFTTAVDVNSYVVLPRERTLNCRLTKQEIQLAKTSYAATVVNLVFD